MQFCVDRISRPDNLRAHKGILRAAGLAITSDAATAAAAIVAQAHEEAQAILARAHEEAAAAVEAAEQRTAASADAFLRALKQEHASLLDRAEDIVVDLAQSLFDRLVSEMSPRERIESALRKILREAPSRLVDAQLRLHPDDIELVPAVEWDLKPDAALPRGACRLEASTGEWYADFEAGATALKQALVHASAQSDAPVAD